MDSLRSEIKLNYYIIIIFTSLTLDDPIDPLDLFDLLDGITTHDALDRGQ